MLGMTPAIRKNTDEAWGALSDLRKSEEDIANKYKIRLPNSNRFGRQSHVLQKIF